MVYLLKAASHLRLLALPPLLTPPADEAICRFSVGDIRGLNPNGTSLLWPQNSVTRGWGECCMRRHMSNARAWNWGTGGIPQAGV